MHQSNCYNVYEIDMKYTRVALSKMIRKDQIDSSPKHFTFLPLKIAQRTLTNNKTAKKKDENMKKAKEKCSKIVTI